MNRPAAASPISFPVNIRRLPKKGLPVTIHADEAQRAGLAALHGIESVERFEAKLLVLAWKGDGVVVRGTIEADITQSCVVTLEPLKAQIRETVEEFLVPEQSSLTRPDLQEGGEILLDAEGADSPETFQGDTMDAGVLAEEIFTLAIDPYPRKPDAELPPPPVEAAGSEPDNTLRAQLLRFRAKQ